ncbi:hypothetical protein NH26_24575 [Flammeovirga pacifica]|uniref:Uncharacterized protein n=2 Tax=Flammeovirga pacifica TaxID=915059 RepID=A0A1S1YUP9_FLAPC|nr:hypothetical protein NH26_24575 [Flammeovirga pacifica]
MILLLLSVSCAHQKSKFADYHKPKTVKWLKSGSIKYAKVKQSEKGRAEVTERRKQKEKEEVFAKMVENNIPMQPIIIQIKGSGMVNYFQQNSFQIEEYKGRLKLEYRRYVIYPILEADFEPLKADVPAVFADLSFTDQKIWRRLLEQAGFRMKKVSEKELEFKLPLTDARGTTK